MVWTAKLKKVGATSAVGYTNTEPKISGRVPTSRVITFSPLELYGASARCSYLKQVDPSLATPESDMIAKLVEQHVDDFGDDFAILASADSLKDFVKSYFVGTVAAGLAYLVMINEGYVWADHFENIGGGNPTHARKPDFAFGMAGTGVALMESKGARSGSLSAFDGTVADGYMGQIEPHLGHVVGNAVATHGYCIGSWLESTTQAEFRIHHTLSPSTVTVGGSGTAPSLATVQRHNFATAFTLAHSAQLGIDLRQARSRPARIVFLRTEWLGRHWLTGLNSLSLCLLASINPRVRAKWAHRLLRRVQRPQLLPLIFAIEEQIASVVFASFLDRSADVPLDALGLRPLDPETLAAVRSRVEVGEGVAFPDGLAILDPRRVQLHFEIVHWDSGGSRFVEGP